MGTAKRRPYKVSYVAPCDSKRRSKGAKRQLLSGDQEGADIHHRQTCVFSEEGSGK